MAKSPERSLLSDVWQAHQLAGKIHADGAKPITRIGGATAITAAGVALEMISSGGTKLIQEKFPSIKFDTLPRLFRELLEDGVVGVAYTVANTQLKEPLPKIKLRHFTTSTIGSVLVVGVEGVGGKVSGKLQERKERGRKKMEAESDAQSSTQDATATAESAPTMDATSPAVEATTETKKSLLDYINPVTALGADEARMAVMDWYRAYKAVVAGTQDEFVKTNKPKDPKEPMLTKETTIIFLGNDQQLASALSTVSGEQVTS